MATILVPTQKLPQGRTGREWRKSWHFSCFENPLDFAGFDLPLSKKTSIRHTSRSRWALSAFFGFSRDGEIEAKIWFFYYVFLTNFAQNFTITKQRFFESFFDQKYVSYFVHIFLRNFH